MNFDKLSDITQKEGRLFSDFEDKYIYPESLFLSLLEWLMISVLFGIIFFIGIIHDTDVTLNNWMGWTLLISIILLFVDLILNVIIGIYGGIYFEGVFNFIRELSIKKKYPQFEQYANYMNDFRIGELKSIIRFRNYLEKCKEDGIKNNINIKKDFNDDYNLVCTIIDNKNNSDYIINREDTNSFTIDKEYFDKIYDDKTGIFDFTFAENEIKSKCSTYIDNINIILQDKYLIENDKEMISRFAKLKQLLSEIV